MVPEEGDNKDLELIANVSVIKETKSPKKKGKKKDLKKKERVFKYLGFVLNI